MLRCLQIGLRLSDLDDIDYGQVMDLLIESSNDNQTYKRVATQEDFDRW